MQIVIISDVFSTSGQFEWMLGTFLEQIASCSQEDVPCYSALVYGVLKCAAGERTVSCMVTSWHWVHACCVRMTCKIIWTLECCHQPFFVLKKVRVY